MIEFLGYETSLRLIPFLVILFLMAGWEAALPRRTDISRLKRWPGNLSIFLLDVIMLALLPVTAVAAAVVSIEYKFGLFFWFELNFWPKVIITLLLLDLAIYWQHRLFHLIPPLWRIHRMHHTDTGFDVTTALRFHPIEILISMLIKAGLIILLGAPVFAVVAFEIILNGCAMFNHSNISMPKWCDALVRWIIVTPDMHRVHHSSEHFEFNMNYGFALSIWDRLFHSYRAQPQSSHLTMTIGQNEFKSETELRLDQLLTQPFRNQ